MRRDDLCRVHRHGAEPIEEPFFKPGCPACEAKAEKRPEVRSYPPPITNIEMRRKFSQRAWEMRQRKLAGRRLLQKRLAAAQT